MDSSRARPTSSGAPGCSLGASGGTTARNPTASRGSTGTPGNVSRSPGRDGSRSPDHPTIPRLSLPGSDDLKFSPRTPLSPRAPMSSRTTSPHGAMGMHRGGTAGSTHSPPRFGTPREQLSSSLETKLESARRRQQMSMANHVMRHSGGAAGSGASAGLGTRRPNPLLSGNSPSRAQQSARSEQRSPQREQQRQQQQQQQQEPHAQLPQLQLHLYNGCSSYLEPVAAPDVGPPARTPGSFRSNSSTNNGTRPGSFTLSGCYGGSLTASASASACNPGVEASETDAAAAAAAAATVLASNIASMSTIRGGAAASSSGLIAAPRPPDGTSTYAFTSPTGSSSSRCNGALVAAASHQDAEEQRRETARASRSSDLGSSSKSNAEHASAQFTSSVHLMGSNHGIHGHNGSQADLAQSTIAGAGLSDQSSTYPSAEVVRVEAADGTLGAMEQDCADMDTFTSQPSPLVLDMSPVASPDWEAATRTAADARGILGCGGINVEQDLAELRSRICHLELKLEQRDGASLAEAHAQAAALKKEFGQLENTLAEALRELDETKNQVRALQQQMEAGTNARPDQAMEPCSSGSDVNATSTKVLTPSFPRRPAPAILPPQGVMSSRAFPASPDRESVEAQGGAANLWAPPLPRSLPPSLSSESFVGVGAGASSLGCGGASASGGFLEWQQQPQQQPFEGGQSTPTTVLTPSRPRPPVVQGLSSAGLSSLRTCLPSPPETVRVPPAPAASYVPAVPLTSAKACITAAAQVQSSRGPSAIQHVQQQQQQQQQPQQQQQHQYVHQPTQRTGSAPPPGGMQLCHTPVRGGATCHRLLPGGIHSQGGSGTPVYPAQRPAVRGGA